MMGYKAAVIKILRRILLNHITMMRFMNKQPTNLPAAQTESEELYIKTEGVRL